MMGKLGIGIMAREGIGFLGVNKFGQWGCWGWLDLRMGTGMMDGNGR